MSNLVEHAAERPSPRAVLSRLPGAMEAIAQRCAEFPEYRVWLEQFNPGMLEMIDEHNRGLGD